MKLFTYKNFEVKVNNEIIHYEEFNDILKRDKSAKKEQAIKEFSYIYHSCDLNSIAVLKGFNRKETFEYARKNSNLDVKWTEDDLIEKAKDKYIELNGNLQLNMFITISRVFRNMEKAIAGLDEELAFRLEKLKKETLIESVDIDNKKEDINFILSKLEKLTDLADKIPDRLKAVKTAELNAINENKKQDIMRGGKNVPISSISTIKQ